MVESIDLASYLHITRQIYKKKVRFGELFFDNSPNLSIFAERKTYPLQYENHR